MPRIFVSQRRVQQWTEEGRVTIDGNTMTLPELGRSFRLTEAFFIERMVAGSSDTLKLAGRVKTRNQIAVLGGEVFLNSLLIGDDAYEGRDDQQVVSGELHGKPFFRQPMDHRARQDLQVVKRRTFRRCLPASDAP